MKPQTIITLVILLSIAVVLIILKEWYALAAFGVLLVFFLLRRLRRDLFG
jgi:hypothetical protein